MQEEAAEIDMIAEYEKFLEQKKDEVMDVDQTQTEQNLVKAQYFVDLEKFDYLA